MRRTRGVLSDGRAPEVLCSVFRVVFRFVLLLIVLFSFSFIFPSVFEGFANAAFAQGLQGSQGSSPVSDRNSPSCTLQMNIEGAVTPATLDYLERGFKRASDSKCRSILLNINTPGGNLQTTRLIVEKILSSPIPVLCLVGPPGGHAGSAGAIILLSCHVAGAEPGTNLGAATPISGGGAALDEDMRNKVIQDTESWAKSLARHRGRNLDVAGEIVTKAKAIDAEEAAKLKVIDVLAGDPSQFLQFAEGREVKMAGHAVERVQVGALTVFESDLRNDFLQFLTDPEMAYLIFMASLALLFFEFTHPGTVVPGVVGGIGLIVSFMAFQKLNVWWGGVSLIGLGLALLIAEAFVPSFGALGIGGIVAFAVGSFLLYDPAVTGEGLSWGVILGTTLTLGVAMLGLALLAFKTRHRGKARSEIALIGQKGEVMSFESPSLRRGMLMVQGEYWRFKSDRDLSLGATVVVVKQEGLTLIVKPAGS